MQDSKKMININFLKKIFLINFDSWRLKGNSIWRFYCHKDTKNTKDHKGFSLEF